jgi:hypothetical protein
MDIRLNQITTLFKNISPKLNSIEELADSTNQLFLKK